ncbi:hypothetical protein [Poseidonocella sedimentorum]|uniref:Restriction endonuclease n=1 Tax=Poseidonocella sedimentorum TaxID=871652 RepID=A0A1I6D527_9RHOB|nr:hypothetical protein [Poseidonocella sedimentorum]SFR00471.1 hypothetical protein SAMN04515673_102164 [Poseidonocella sedimentorum]
MAPNPSLRELADNRNWIAFGQALSTACDDPAQYGFQDASQLLAHVAQLRGVEPASLRNPLAAVNWMKENAPKALEEENAKIPMTGVLTLSQISIVSKKLADELAPRFFCGQISRRQLDIALRRAEREHGRRVAGHVRMKRAMAFEEEVFTFLKKHPSKLEFGHDVEIVRTSKDNLVPSDFTVLRDGRPVAAVECKAHRGTRHRRYLMETLAMAALRAADGRKSILVVPESWGPSTAEISRLADELSLSNVWVAVFEKHEGQIARLTYLGNTSSKEPS